MNSSDSGLAYELVAPTRPAQASVIWLHGLGADGHDFVPIVPALKLDDLAIRFVFPHAALQPVSINMGMTMPAWFDIYSLDREAEQDEAGILQSCQDIWALIEQERQQGISYDRIFLAGFSQGGALAMAAALQFHHSLAGVLMLSAYLPIADTLMTQLSPTNRAIPIFIAHGDQDAVVDKHLAELSMQILQQHQFKVDWHPYSMGHEMCQQETDDIASWLRQQHRPLKN